MPAGDGETTMQPLEVITIPAAGSRSSRRTVARRRPQGYGGDQPAAAGRIQKSDFLRQDGAVTDPCPGPKLDQGYAGEAGPDKVLPEAPYAALLPALAVAVLAGGVALRRRHRRPVEAARAVR